MPVLRRCTWTGRPGWHCWCCCRWRGRPCRLCGGGANWSQCPTGRRSSGREREDVKCEDVKCEDVKCEDVKCEDVKCEDVKCEDVKRDRAEVYLAFGQNGGLGCGGWAGVGGVWVWRKAAAG